MVLLQEMRQRSLISKHVWMTFGAYRNLPIHGQNSNVCLQWIIRDINHCTVTPGTVHTSFVERMDRSYSIFSTRACVGRLFASDIFCIPIQVWRKCKSCLKQIKIQVSWWPTAPSGIFGMISETSQMDPTNTSLSSRSLVRNKIGTRYMMSVWCVPCAAGSCCGWGLSSLQCPLYPSAILQCCGGY